MLIIFGSNSMNFQGSKNVELTNKINEVVD